MQFKRSVALHFFPNLGSVTSCWPLNTDLDENNGNRRRGRIVSLISDKDPGSSVENSL